MWAVGVLSAVFLVVRIEIRAGAEKIRRIAAADLLDVDCVGARQARRGGKHEINQHLAAALAELGSGDQAAGDIANFGRSANGRRLSQDTSSGQPRGGRDTHGDEQQSDTLNNALMHQRISISSSTRVPAWLVKWRKLRLHEQ